MIGTGSELSGDSGRYIDATVIAQGGAGDVFRVQDTKLHRVVAIKRLRPEDSPNSVPDQAAIIEARHMALLQHPNIVTIHDFVQDDTGIFVVMEYVSGRTVQDAAEEAPLEYGVFLEFAKQTLDGLIAAHAQGLIHHDIKPGNIMMTSLPDGGFQIKILDFGLAEMVGLSSQIDEVEGEVVGTIFTMPPEQLERQKMDVRSDLYSFGCVCYFALTGEYPFQGATVADVIESHLEHRFKPLEEFRTDLPPLLCDWVMRLIARSPVDRFQSAKLAEDELKEAFFPPHGTTKILPDQKTPGEARPVKMGRSRLPLMAALIAIVGGGGGGFLFWNRQQPPELAASLISATPLAALARPTPLPPISTRKLMTDVGKPVTVEGTITGFRENKSGAVRYLNFLVEGEQGLSLVFFVRDGGGEFTKEKISDFVSKNIRVTGELREFEKTPQIIVKNLSQITVL